MRKHKRINRAVRAKERRLASVTAMADADPVLPVLQRGLRVVVSSRHPTWGGKKGVVRWVGERSCAMDECSVQIAIRGAGYDTRELLIRVSSSFLAPVIEERRAEIEHDAYQRAAKHGRGWHGEILPAELPGGNIVTTSGTIDTVPARARGLSWAEVAHAQTLASIAEHATWLKREDNR